MFELTRNHHARPVNWRWRRAELVVTSRRAINRFTDDELLIEAVALQRQLRQRRTDEQKVWLADTYPHQFEAWCLAIRDQSQLTKYEIEARLLAREPLVDIAKKTAVSVTALAYFEAWFFNVMDRIDCPAYILHHVLGESVQLGLTERDYDMLWKLYGYHGGPYVLDAMIYKWENPTRPDDPNNVGAFLVDSFRSQLRSQAERVLRTTRLSHATEMILSGYLQWQEMEKNGGRGGGSGTQEAILANMQAFLEQLPWEFDEDKKDDNTTIAAFDAAGIGLRSSELMMIGTEQAPAGLLGVIDQFTQSPGGSA